MTQITSALIAVFTCGFLFGWIARMFYARLGSRIPFTTPHTNMRKAQQLNDQDRQALKEALQMNAKDRNSQTATAEEEKDEIPWNSAWGGESEEIDPNKDIKDIL